MSAADFDAYCEEHGITEEDVPAAFAEWLVEQTGEAVIGGPVDEPPEFAAPPE
jgi:hypothetical protein